MKRKHPQMAISLSAIVICMIVIASPLVTLAQPGLSGSISYDFLPYQDFDEPIVRDVTEGDTTFYDNPQVQLQKLRATLSYPLIFSEGRTVLANELSYQLIDFKYRRLVTPVERVHSASYTLMLQHRMSHEWSVWALATPSMASDLQDEVSADDFHFQAAVVGIRHFSERFSFGFGAAYSTQFGSAVPMPVLAFDWNNGKNLMAKAILPVSFEFWYRPGPRLDLGLILSGDGNNFNADPDIYDAISPELRYTMMTLGPAAKIKLFDQVLLNIQAGAIILHRFEFFDKDIEVASYDLKPSQYVRIGVSYGG